MIKFYACSSIFIKLNTKKLPVKQNFSPKTNSLKVLFSLSYNELLISIVPRDKINDGEPRIQQFPRICAPCSLLQIDLSDSKRRLLQLQTSSTTRPCKHHVDGTSTVGNWIIMDFKFDIATLLPDEITRIDNNLLVPSWKATSNTRCRYCELKMNCFNTFLSPVNLNTMLQQNYCWCTAFTRVTIKNYVLK